MPRGINCLNAKDQEHVMRRFLGIALVAILAGFGAAGGYFSTAAYLGARGSFDGFNHACQTLQTAEAKQVITRQQRSAIVDALMQETAKASGDTLSDANFLVEYLKGDCSRSVWAAITKT